MVRFFGDGARGFSAGAGMLVWLAASVLVLACRALASSEFQAVTKTPALMKRLEKEFSSPTSWEGNLNSSHGSAVVGHPKYVWNKPPPGVPLGTHFPAGWKVLSPGCDELTPGKECSPCLTQLPASKIIPAMHRGPRYCTSCRPGNVLLTLFHKSKAGPCVYQDNLIKTWCTELDKDPPSGMYLATGGDVENTLCQKMGKATKVIPVSRIVNTTIREAFIKGKVRGRHGNALAKCGIWKQTVCRSGKCEVRKEVRCINVCQLRHYAKPIYRISDLRKRAKAFQAKANRLEAKKTVCGKSRELGVSAHQKLSHKWRRRRGSVYRRRRWRRRRHAHYRRRRYRARRKRHSARHCRRVLVPKEERRSLTAGGWPCNKKLCEGDYGAYACKEISMMI